MDDRVRRLRSRLEGLSRGKAPRGVRYPVELRTEVLGLAREAHGAGMGAGALAKQLGLTPGTITRWGRRIPGLRLRKDHNGVGAAGRGGHRRRGRCS